VQAAENEQAETMRGWLQPLLEFVGAEVLVSDEP
jgi:hypothetical protein